MTASLCDIVVTDSAGSGGDVLFTGAAYGDQ
jgi:hypothetical protein